MSKKVLIVGGGYADIPLILAAKRLGFYIITSGNRAKDLGHQYSDECRLEDFSNKKKMLKLAKSLEIDAVCAACNDFSALTAAYIAENLQLPGHDPYKTSLLIHHKDKYRKFAQEHHIPSPEAKGFDSLECALEGLESLQLPVLVKPVDLTGGKGISKITKTEEAGNKLEVAFQISKAKRIVIEEFVEGSKHGLSTFIQNGRVVFYFSDNEHYYLNPYLVSAASTPSIVPQQAIDILCQLVEKIASILKLKTGIFHIQYILQDDKPIIIEICRRPPGDLYIQFVKYATGVEYPEFIIRSSAGLDCSDLVQVEPRGYFTRHCIMASRNGKVEDIRIDPSIESNIIDGLTWWRKGDSIDNFLVDKLGIIFLRFDSMDEMLSKTKNMHNLIYVNID